MDKRNDLSKALRLRMITFLVVIGSMGSSPPILLAQGLSPVGRWKTVSDETGRVTSIVNITLDKGELSGQIQKLFPPPGKDPNPKCTKCSGENKDKPVLGLKILWGLTQNEDNWEGGYILAPKKGTVYRCIVKVIENGDKLEVRGYIGFSIFGRTQTWLRTE